MKLFRSQLELDVTKGIIGGVGRGAIAGAALSVGTGAAIVSGPVAGVIAVNTAVVANWAAVGSTLGGIAGGVSEWMKQRSIEKEFRTAFAAA